MPTEAKESIKFPGNGVPDDCELPFGCWELNPSSLQKQQVLLITEPSLQPLLFGLILELCVSILYFCVPTYQLIDIWTISTIFDSQISTFFSFLFWYYNIIHHFPLPFHFFKSSHIFDLALFQILGRFFLIVCCHMHICVCTYNSKYVNTTFM